MALILDTGPVVAALDANDVDHDACVHLLSASREPLVVVQPTLVEIDYWLRKRLSLSAWQFFVEDLHAGAYRLVDLDTVQLMRAAELEREYADLGLGFVDAAVIAVCEALGEEKVATLDHRQFRAVRPAHCSFLEILPAVDRV